MHAVIRLLVIPVLGISYWVILTMSIQRSSSGLVRQVHRVWTQLTEQWYLFAFRTVYQLLDISHFEAVTFYELQFSGNDFCYKPCKNKCT